ncbi:uncharacterized protein MELLADRAFT_90899 [Melampsora larici-populina 98AG31]|uniref:CNH domain-containing protein n=1 Tax=Melampsora larici-populina (strain 98AG31 / pathotype 3-4-7) TaxID=747676 RepID=F4R7Y8_MELLP|nr:uncharacterized protein MELLADRAFT_90899 [Melampsora larici-populina 98AG31]EGG11705.1 hypothetical protein MELLADRAFT_90899 [Melampsora larici-populina 98AG31]
MSLKTSILRQDHKGFLLDREEEIKNPESQDLNSSDLNSGVPVILTLVAVPCKRRLILFAWKDAQWITPKEIQIPHQARSVTFSNSLQIFIGYSTGEYAQIKLEINATEALIQINHQISDPFPLPIQTPRTDPNTTQNTSLGSNPVGPTTTTTNHSGGLVSGLFKTTGLASLALSGSNKLSKNSVLSVGPPTNEVIGIRDQLATFMNPEGKLSRSLPNPSTINYPVSPIETMVQSPYLISLLPTPTSNLNVGSSLMIHSIPTLTHVQTIPLSSLDPTKHLQPMDNSPRKKQTGPNEESLVPKLLTVSSAHHGPVVCVSPRLNETDQKINYSLEVFIMVSWSEQINQFIQAGEYSESLALIERLESSVLPNREILIKRLNGLCALLEFKNRNYNQSIDEFIKLNINPAKVVSLYDERISGKLYRSKEVWESLFGGRKMKIDLKDHASDLIDSSTQVSKPSSLINSKIIQQKVIDDNDNDESGSIKSFRSQALHSLKAKASDLSLQKSKLKILQDESDFKESIDVLIRYLTDRRQHVNKAFSNQSSSIDLSEKALDSLKSINLRSSEDLLKLKDLAIHEISDVEELVQIAKIIDTSLFKCYLAIKPTMLGPLCRLPNWCEVDEVESLLLDAKRYYELLDLYHGKKQHDRALRLLKTMGESEEDLEERIDPTIRYLQKLGSDHLSLIFNTSKWIFSMIKTSTSTTTRDDRLIKKSLEIFTEDLSTVESLPKKEVIKFLESEDFKICRVYVEFLVYELCLESIEIHEKLIHLYINEFRKLKGLGQEESSQKIYQSLLNHLIKSKFYSANWVLGRLPLDEMFEARALTLGKIGQHDTALGIYINKLGNIKLAEEYCKRIYSENPELIGEKIYLMLLKIYLRPPPVPVIASQSQAQSRTDSSKGNLERPILNHEIRLKSSLKLLKEEGHLIKSIEEVLDLLPNWIDLIELQSFFKKSLNQLNQTKREIRLEKECLENENQSLKVIGLGVEQRRIKMDEKRLCMKCGKRIGNSVIAVHSPFGEVTHYQCRWEGELENRNGSRNDR